ncbi:MAG: hypothetical protein ACFFBQ_17505 [Promethearchaeota archaeon]
MSTASFVVFMVVVSFTAWGRIRSANDLARSLHPNLFLVFSVPCQR